MRKPMLLLTACVLMTACASSPTTSSVRSTPPTVACAEHEPAERLGAYPVGPVGVDGTHPGDFDQLRAYSREQAVWAVRAAGVVQRNAIQRDTTATCLDAYRARGIIR